MEIMKNLISTLAIFVLLVFTSCEKVEEHYPIDRNEFQNILNIKNIPQNKDDWNAMFFADQGSWMAYSLPSDLSSENYGSLVGPFSIIEGKWISEKIIQLNLFDTEENQIELHSGYKEINYLPGLLSQKYELNNLEIKIESYFVDAYNLVYYYSIKNNGDEDYLLNYNFTGEVFSDFDFEEKNKSIFVNSKTDDKYNLEVLFNERNISKEIIIFDTAYFTSKTSVKIKSAETYQSFAVINISSELFNAFEDDTEINSQTINSHKESNVKRWNKYLSDVITKNKNWEAKEEYHNLVAKSVMTLINNWRVPYGDLQTAGLFPSASIWYFNGFWAWDSWKHAYSLAKFAPEIAKDQVRTMFDLQDEMGMVPDVIYQNKEENNWLDTKPPLSAWAVLEIYKNDGDKDFLEEIYPKIKKYHYWWYEYRDNNKNEICEYGATQDTLIAAKWESGMDNAVRFDNSSLKKINDYAWSLNQESVDLNAFLYAEKLYLSEMATAIGEEKESKKYLHEAENLKEKIKYRFYDKESGFFYDFDLINNDYINVQGPEGWIPLWANATDDYSAKTVKEIMTDTTKFATYIPFPTVAKDDPQFSLGYWRGTVWLDQVYFAIKGLRNYGYDKEAQFYTKQVFNRIEGVKNSDNSIRENYNATTGKGLRVNNFSWSAAALIELYLMFE